MALSEDHSAPAFSSELALSSDVRRMLAAWRADTDETKRDLLRFLNDQVLREQELFWIRFAGFAAIHAGLFALVGSPPKGTVVIGGGVLGGLWLLVQFNSLWYALRVKDHYHDLRQHMGVVYLSNPASGRSSTLLGAVASAAVLALWVVTALGAYGS